MGGSLFFVPGEVVLSLPADSLQRMLTGQSSTVVHLEFAGAATNPHMQGTDLLPGTVNYMIGNDRSKWHTNIETYAGVRYEDLYPGIDVHYDGNQGNLKSTYMVRPGVDPNLIRWRYDGASHIALDPATGQLLVTLAGSIIPSLFETAPIAWQEIEGQRVPVQVAYTLSADPADPDGMPLVGFDVGAYDRAYPLIIDPALLYSTFWGGSGVDTGYAITVDDFGTYITGETTSPDFPGNPVSTPREDQDPVQPPASGGSGDSHVFVTKILTSGEFLVFSSYFGGSSGDIGYGIAVDEDASVYVTGATRSPDFPTGLVTQTFQIEKGGLPAASDAFVTKLISTGTELEYSTFLGGAPNDEGHDITIDRNQNAYVVGWTQGEFPTTDGVVQPAFGGQRDVFVTRLSADGQTLVYSTYLGGTGNDGGLDSGTGNNDGPGIEIDSDNNAYIAGMTESDDFPTAGSPAPFQAALQGASDAFATKLNSDGSALVYSTYLGGTADERGRDIAVDSNNNAYVTGFTDSDDFPTEKAPAEAQGTGRDAFLTKFSVDGSSLEYSTDLGGVGTDEAHGVDVDIDNNPYVTGWTDNGGEFPTVNAPGELSSGLKQDVFVAKFVFVEASDSLLLNYSAFLAGSDNEIGRSIAIDQARDAHITGFTISSNFPIQGGEGRPPLDPTSAGTDAFISKVGSTILNISPAELIEGNSGENVMVFSVALSNPSGEEVTVDFEAVALSASDTSATEDVDFVPITGTVSIPTGGTLSTVEVTIFGDVDDELNERFLVRLDPESASPEGTVVGQSEAEGLIRDDDPGVLIECTPQPCDETFINESDSPPTGDFTVRLINNLTGEPVQTNSNQFRHDIDVEYQILAEDPPDQAPEITSTTPPSPLTMQAPNQVEQTITVEVDNDDEVELDETFLVEIDVDNDTAAAIVVADNNQARGRIRSEDVPTIFIDNPVVNPEGNTDTTPMPFQVTLSAAAPFTVTVDYAIDEALSSATAGEDFELIDPGTLAFGPGNAGPIAINVPIIGDRVIETDETVVMRLNNPVNGQFTDDATELTGEGTIFDDDFPSIAFEQEVSIVNENDLQATIGVTLSAVPAQDVTINYTARDQTAIEGIDFELPDPDRELIIPAGEVRGTFPVNVFPDGEPGLTKTLELELLINDVFASKATLGEPFTSTLQIQDGDTGDIPGARFITDTFRVNENAGEAFINVSLTITPSRDLVFGYQSRDGTALAGQDYTPVSNTLTFISGTKVLTFTVPIIDNDQATERQRTVNLSLSNLNSPLLGRLVRPFTSTLIIQDDEFFSYVYLPAIFGRPVSAQFTGSPYIVLESEPSVVITVTLSAPVGRSATVDYATRDNQAIGGIDFVPVSGTLVFAPGVSVLTFTIDIIQDDINEPANKVFGIGLTNPTGGILLGNNVDETVTIVDDDFRVSQQTREWTSTLLQGIVNPLSSNEVRPPQRAYQANRR